LAAAEYSTELRAAGKKEATFEKETGFNLAGSNDLDSFKEKVSDGNGGTRMSFTANSMDKAGAYIERTDAAYDNVNLLKDSNNNAASIKTTIDTYKSVMDEDGEKMDGPLTQKDYYGKLNSDGYYKDDNGRTFTAENLTNSLVEGGREDGSVADSYEDYLNAYMASDAYQTNYGAVARSEKRDDLEE
jgi:hypothetical protein